MSGLDGNSVDQKFVIGDTQHHRTMLLRNRRPEFIPRRPKLSPGAAVIEPIQANVLHQDIEAMEKRDSGCLRRRLAGACACARNKLLPRNDAKGSLRRKTPQCMLRKS